MGFALDICTGSDPTGHVNPEFTEHIRTTVEYQFGKIRYRLDLTDPPRWGFRFTTWPWIGFPAVPAVSTRDTRDDKMQRSWSDTLRVLYTYHTSRG